MQKEKEIKKDSKREKNEDVLGLRSGDKTWIKRTIAFGKKAAVMMSWAIAIGCSRKQ